jgi:DNA-3-methyladenine glycosylase II
MENKIHLNFTGDYSFLGSVNLASKASFVEPLNSNSEILDLPLLIENSWKSVGVRIIQESNKVTAEILANPNQATKLEVKNQLERMFSLNIDATNFNKIIVNDKIIQNLYNQNKGIRPVLFASCYEGAARAIIGHQLPVKQAARITARISENHGTKLDFNGTTKFVFPAPNVLETLPYITGLSERKVDQLRILGAKTGDWLSSESLLKITREQATIELQKLPGIGPFSSELILLRGAGDTDAFPLTEMRLHRAIIQAYQLDENTNIETLLKIAENWRPFRTWIGLYLRNSISK